MQTISALYRANRRLWSFLGERSVGKVESFSTWTFGNWRQRQGARELIDQELHYTELVEVATRVIDQCKNLVDKEIYNSDSNRTWISYPLWTRNEKRDLERLDDLLQKIKKK